MKIILTEATLSGQKFAAWLPNCPTGWNSSISLIIKLSIIYINLLLCHRNFNRAFVAIRSTTAGSTDLSYNAHYRPQIYHDDVVLIFVSLTSL